MSFDDQDGGPRRADAPADPAAEAQAEVVVWLRVDGDPLQPAQVEELAMRSEGGLPLPIDVAVGEGSTHFAGEAMVMGAMVDDPQGTAAATRFKARGTVAVTLHGSSFLAVVIAAGADDVAFWMAEDLGEVRGQVAADGDGVELTGHGWAMVVTELTRVVVAGDQLRTEPATAAAFLAAWHPGDLAPGRPGAVPTEPVSGQVPVVVPAAVGGGHDDDGHDYVDLPREGRVPRWAAALLVVALLAGVSAFGLNWWYQRQVDPPGEPGETVSVVVPEGSSTSQIGDLLADEGVVSSGMVFNFYVGRKGAGPFQAGTYQLQENSDFDTAIEVLEAGPGKGSAGKETTKVTIPEGFTIADIVARISEVVPRLTVADLTAALEGGKVPSELKPADVDSYEGLLFPATYEVGDDDDAVEVLGMMAAEMEKRVEALGIQAAQAHVKEQWGLELSAYDMVKVASMIQFEAAVPADAAKIGAVTYNRLEQGMPLQYDSTSIYEAELLGRDPNTIDYQVSTPFNTRVVNGLPPTPVAAPGEYALTGAMEPEDGDWLYFVLTEPKVVSFSVDYQQFLRDKDTCIANDLGCG